MDDLVRCAWSRPLVLKPLNQILATVMLLGLSLAPAASHAAEPSTDHDVVIVGAGVSGLYAAYTLINLGYDVLVVEAST